MVEAMEERVFVGGAPFLGICVGMQLLASRGLEHGETLGLDWIAGEVREIEVTDPAIKIPHMGWNTVRFIQPDSPLAAELKTDGENFYFVHSFHCVPADPSLVLAECDYGGVFTAAIAKGRCFATQFHPEKSQSVGLTMLKNFAMV